MPECQAPTFIDETHEGPLYEVVGFGMVTDSTPQVEVLCEKCCEKLSAVKGNPIE